MSKSDALRRASDAGLDLALISPNAKPPVARIMDYGKYRFEQQKKLKEARKNSKTVSVKEIRLSTTIEGNDFETKLKHVRKFISKEGAQVRVSIRFRGRAITHKELGPQVLEKMAEVTSDIANVISKPKMEGRSMFLMLAPKSDKDKKKKQLIGGNRNMPKMKTHRASAKRFKRTANGGLKRHHAFTGHRFHGKTKKQRRHLRKAAMVSKSDMKRIKQMVAQMH